MSRKILMVVFGIVGVLMRRQRVWVCVNVRVVVYRGVMVLFGRAWRGGSLSIV